MRWAHRHTMKIDLAKPKHRLIVVIGVLTVAGLWVYVTMLVIPTFQRTSRLTQEVRTARDQLRALEDVLANEEEVREQYERLGETVASLRSFLPSEDELPSILERLSEVARRANVRIQSISPGLSFTEKDLADLLAGGEFQQPVYRTIPIQIDALAGYHELGTFLSLVETGPIPVEIASLRISTNMKEFHRHNMRLVLNVFFSASGPEPARLPGVGGS